MLAVVAVFCLAFRHGCDVLVEWEQLAVSVLPVRGRADLPGRLGRSHGGVGLSVELRSLGSVESVAPG